MADRKARILDVARRNGRVSVDALADVLGVSAHTVRRDINSLCSELKLRRLHGGAEFVQPQANIPYPRRAVLNFEAKMAIARAVADIVPDGATVFISVGTTPALLAGALAHRRGLTVVTNNLNAAMALSDAEDVRIILAGGELRLPDRDVLGPDVIATFTAYRADFGIYGVGGIDRDGSLLDFHESEVRVRESIHARSRATILVADHSKFGRIAAAVGGHLADPDHVVIDRRPGPPYADVLDPMGARVTVAMEQDRDV
ncbi:DeoR/GlpR family DNA-binding transcription regulator [Tropicibacter alexandrii]|uniref:DeoR/GlpR family DNA-binding transcription regulator n=1 Tax=Tropicibacter alexandrii TaxID=2267683 RepID=UPI000EF481EC|nr:DeoR/GlpR family DNA-binding transcription regulator [Tropicibacter alexandrii]